MKLPDLKLKLFPHILLVSLLIFTSCDWFKDLFKKDDPRNVENISDTGSLSIGPNGGTVILNNLEIKVPAGAFTSETNITINELTGDAGLGEYANSKLYQLAGLPENFIKPT
ncbi:MAG: hypothetical protein JW833_05220 [Prolixibacteraceae bacterium]|nr:hypothetical protein [Prolixibacteraceae bacterium]